MVDAQSGKRDIEENGVHMNEDMSEDPQHETQRGQSPADGSSDSDNAERTARNKLKKASIAALSEQTATYVGSNTPHNSNEATTPDSRDAETQPIPRGRLPRKRSFENSQNEDSPTNLENGSADYPQPKSGHHKRMRSRDISSGAYVAVGAKYDNGTEPLEEESDDEAHRSPGGPGVLIDVPARETTTPPPPDSAQGSDPLDITSPKKKRSRDQFDTEDTSKNSDLSASEQPQSSIKDQLIVGNNQLAPSVSRSAIGEPEKKRHRDASLPSSADETLVTAEPKIPKSSTAIQSTSGFANTSTASPFGNFASAPKASETVPAAEIKSTTTSAFANSGLSAFANSEKSPFGAFGSSQSANSGGFGSGVPPSGFGSSSSTSKSGFGNTGVTSPFGANRTTGFASLGGFGSSTVTGFGGSGFGSGLKPLGGLSSFASGSATSAFGGGTSKQKAFGVSQAEADDGSDGGDSNEDEAEDRPRDKRFVEQDLETGEEDEQTIFSCRAKLFGFEGKEWKERGVGTVKLNVKYVLVNSRSSQSPEPQKESEEDDEEDIERALHGLEKKARLIMRTDGVHRVVLNTPVFPGMKVGTPDGAEPTGKTMQLTGMEGGKGVLYTLKVGKDEVVKELWRRIVDVQQEL